MKRILIGYLINDGYYFKPLRSHPIKTILAFTYLHRHLRKLMPVLHQLKSNSKYKICLVVMTREEEVFAQEEGIEALRLDCFSFQPRQANFDLSWGLPALVEVINGVRPDLFLCMEVNYILRNAIRHCRNVGVPTLVLQHGTPNMYSLHAFAPFEADFFACWGGFTRDYLCREGVRADRIILTGGVPFDDLLKINANDRSEIGVQLGLDDSKKWLIFTTQSVGPGGRPGYEEIKASVNEVARIMLGESDWEVFFQVHPQQNPVDIIEMFNEDLQSVVKVGRYSNTEELIAKCDAMITFFSTTAMDAVIRGKPLMLINLIDDMEYFPFVSMGAAFGVKKVEDFPEVLNNLLRADDLLVGQMSAANHVNMNNDGRALERILSLIDSLLEPETEGDEC